MEENQRNLLLEKVKEFFKNEIVEAHIKIACKKASKISSYNINPFLVKYLANFLNGNDSPESIAKALVLPRVLGTSINTIFGNKVQKMISSLFEGMGSTTQGIDIEFIDSRDGRKKYCQLKSGPNTINKDDVKTLSDHFKAIKNLARTNNLDIRIDDLVIGVLYGEEKELSAHYKKLKNDFPVIIGEDFWHRLTGEKSFYQDLIDTIGEVAIEMDGTKILQETIDALAKEVKDTFS